VSVHDTEYYAEVKELLSIPADEPIFVLRGKDRFAARAIEKYFDLAINGTAEWRNQLQECIDGFHDFADLHPDRMKYPD
jgi:hypothetical protein